ncbi:MAG: hypothetical protein BWY21_00266 [Parcubacteria group bacterium ADurb.Bin216]|nr:MAG: hypothetical protein BWY21_00266 [Parcubacteria group bacterium ADurb.Bin216]
MLFLFRDIMSKIVLKEDVNGMGEVLAGIVYKHFKKDEYDDATMNKVCSLAVECMKVGVLYGEMPKQR